MALTLKNYATALLPDLLLQAKKNKVRECDEIEKGRFVAYVDDGSESFDVSLTVQAGNEITQHTCDCNSTSSFCKHKAALIIHIATGKKIKDVIKVRKKENKTDALLENIDAEQLKEWVKGLIIKNKDIEFSFVHYFSVKEQFTPAEVTKIVNDAVKAVVGNKKTIDMTQLKKIVELWSEMLAPIAAHYHANITNEQSFLNFHIMLETCVAFQFKVDSGSNRISKFIEETLQKSVEPISNLHVEEAWDKAVSYFINYVPDGVNRVRMHYLLHLKNIFSISGEDRKIKIIDWLAKQFEKSHPDTLMNGTPYCKFIFEITVENNLFPKYSRLFKPIVFDNEYNQKLITMLIDNNNLDQAKKYCAEQIKNNFREEYNILYLKFLKEILLIQKDEEELANVLTKLFPFTFDFDDYLFISKRLPEDERKKWRTKMLTRSRSVSYPYKKDATEFCFKLADSEKSYRKMIDYIDSYTPYSIILQYFENMALTDKNRLLEVMLRRTDSYGWSLNHENEEKDEVYFPELFKLFEKHYLADYLKMVIANAEKDRWHFRLNNLMVYIKKQLSVQNK
jgi:hypothetical protein